jgi:hypothetical protein
MEKFALCRLIGLELQMILLVLEKQHFTLYSGDNQGIQTKCSFPKMNN